MSEDNLTKIHLDLPRNEEVGGEAFWAENLGNDLYRMRNTPFHVYGINFHDIVYAKAQSEELKPSILKVHEHFGHKILRVLFLDKASAEERAARLSKLNEFKAYHENADGTLFAIDVEQKAIMVRCVTYCINGKTREFCPTKRARQERASVLMRSKQLTRRASVNG